MYLTWRVPVAMALAVLAVFLVPSLWLVAGWFLVLLLLVGLDVASAPPPSRLTFEREATAPVRLGENLTAILHVHNPTQRRYRGALRDVWLPGAGPGEDHVALRLEPGVSGTLAVPLTPNRRGFRRTDRVTVRSLGPLGLAGRQQSFAVDGVVQVLPAFASRAHLPSRVVQLKEMEGRSQVRTFGRGSEFDSLREYVRGDDVRSIDWRATARHREPVVRTWRPERDRRVVIVLDTSRLSAGRLGDTTRLDAGMDACLLLAALAGHAGDSVAWIAGDRDVLAEVAPGRARVDALRDMLTAMAPLEPRLVEAHWRSLAERIEKVGRRGALVVLVTPFEPAVVEENLLPVLPGLAHDHRVVIASVADPALREMSENRDDVRNVYDAAAAERMATRAASLRDVVERLGVTVLERDADALPPALADEYLRLKREGML